MFPPELELLDAELDELALLEALLLELLLALLDELLDALLEELEALLELLLEALLLELLEDEADEELELGELPPSSPPPPLEQAPNVPRELTTSIGKTTFRNKFRKREGTSVSFMMHYPNLSQTKIHKNCGAITGEYSQHFLFGFL